MSYTTPEHYQAILDSQPKPQQVCPNCGQADCRGGMRKMVIGLLICWVLIALIHFGVAIYAKNGWFLIMPLLTLGCVGGTSGI